MTLMVKIEKYIPGILGIIRTQRYKTELNTDTHHANCV